MTDKPETIFADGFFFNRPRDGAPTFVKGQLSFKVKEFKEFLDKYDEGNKVNIDLMESASGKLYGKLNTWKPKIVEMPSKPVYPQPEGEPTF